MASKKASISIAIIADAAKAQAGFKEAEKAAGSFGQQMGGLTKTIAATFATKAITDFAKSSINAASDLGESINAVQVTFGQAADGILAFGETASKTVGLSAQDFNSFAVQFAGFTKQIAGDQGDIVQVTEDLTTRIADFASVMNLDIPQAAQVFQSSLAGQTEPIRRFGIDLSAAAVAAFAVEQGISESAATMTEAEKVQARYQLLMQETAKAAGDFANTSDSLANSQRILQADFKNMQAELGQALLPVMEQLVSIAKIAVDAFMALPEPLQKIVTLAAVLGGGMASASRALQGFGLAAKTANIAVGALGGVMLLASVHAQQAAEDAAKFQDAMDGLTRASDENAKMQLGAAAAAAIFAGEFGNAEQFVAKLAETSIGMTERLRDMNAIQELFGLTTEEVNGIIDEQIAGFQQAEADAERTSAAVDGLTVAEQEAAEATEAQNQALKEQEDALNAVLTATLAQFNAALAYESQTWRTTDAIDAYTQAQLDAFTGATQGEEAARAIAEAQNDAASAALSQAAAAAKLAEEQAAMRGETLTAAEAAQIQIDELNRVAQTLDPASPLRQQLEGYVRQLGNIPRDVETELRVSVNAWLNSMQGGGGAGGGRLTFRAQGGPVSPTLGPYIVGEEGPEVFIPGQTGMILPNTALIDAMAARPTAAGGVAAPTIVVNVAGSVTSERDLVESIRRGLVNSQRNGSPLIYSNI
jgi:hypothetical protein